ncbi:helix-turn-helix domain-containing protein [Bradyrhizobium sp. BR 1432]|uniref:helix-turn-helix domain-containing protein n=1 Tax=Bradyrhizobium sp. BR 1432 TaxID=3447966 RepID=UPI003EE771F2
MRPNAREEVEQDFADPRPSHQRKISFAERLTCTIDEACQATGLGRTKLYELIGAGKLDTRSVGRRRLVLVSSLQALLEVNCPSPSGKERVW